MMRWICGWLCGREVKRLRDQLDEAYAESDRREALISDMAAQANNFRREINHLKAEIARLERSR